MQLMALFFSGYSLCFFLFDDQGYRDTDCNECDTAADNADQKRCGDAALILARCGDCGVFYLAAGAFSAYSIGTNSSASVTAFYYDASGQGANILTDARFTAIIGGIAIAIGVLTFSKRVMMQTNPILSK